MVVVRHNEKFGPVGRVYNKALTLQTIILVCTHTIIIIIIIVTETNVPFLSGIQFRFNSPLPWFSDRAYQLSAWVSAGLVHLSRKLDGNIEHTLVNRVYARVIIIVIRNNCLDYFSPTGSKSPDLWIAKKIKKYQAYLKFSIMKSNCVSFSDDISVCRMLAASVIIAYFGSELNLPRLLM